jgi:hypothetical protein
MGVVTFSDGVKEDGIHRDGSYLQHDGILCTFAHRPTLVILALRPPLQEAADSESRARTAR